MSKQVTLGLVQMACSDDYQDNLSRAVTKAEECAKKGAQIICLPELFLSPYFCQGPKDKKYFALAEAVPGPATAALGAVAKKYKVVILCSLFEETTSGQYFNSLVVIGTKGEIIGTYHKMHIPSLPVDYYAENYYFEKGDGGFPVFKTPFTTVGTLICYDQWFPEGARIAASKGAQILFYPTAIGWPESNPDWKKEAEHEAWQITQRSHGIDNNIFVAAINRIGLEEELRFWGTSFVSDPYGRVLAKASTDKEEIMIVPIDLEVTEKMREEWPFLEERRIKAEDAEQK